MDFLLKLIAMVWDWFSWAFRTLWGAFIVFAQTIWAKWLLVVGWILTVVNYGLDVLHMLTNMLGQWLFSSFNLALPNGLSAALSLANYIFPLDVLLVFTAAYIQVIIVMMAWRHYKSFIPGAVSGGT